MSDNKTFLTKEKIAELEAELKELVTVKRKEIADQLESTRALGDLSENAEYHEARDAQGQLEARIAEIEHTLKNAEVIKKKRGGSIQVGSVVWVRRGKERTDREYTIVGAEEADITAGLISYQSPLGQALMGQEKGGAVEVNTPNGLVKYTVVKVQ